MSSQKNKKHFKGLPLNARYNAGFARLYKKQDGLNQDENNSLLPYNNINMKNAVIQLSVGYLFKKIQFYFPNKKQELKKDCFEIGICSENKNRAYFFACLPVGYNKSIL